MQAYYGERFQREMGCTAAELVRWLPGAVEHRPLELGEQGAEVRFDGDGRLTLRWQVLSPRRIALITLPRLQVDFAFDGLDEATRQRVMKRFDMYIQRGGG